MLCKTISESQRRIRKQMKQKNDLDLEVGFR